MTVKNENLALRPRQVFRPDPVIGWSLTPNSAVQVKFRNGILQKIGPDGWRNIPHPSSHLGTRVALYGCSFTYGTGLADEETFTAQLQHKLPHTTIINRGIGGHGTVQNLLQMRRDIKRQSIDAAVFAIISDHRFRNIAHPQRMRQYLAPEWYKLGVEHVPVARMNADGSVRILYHPIWQPVIKEADFDIFLPDDYMINSATLGVLSMVKEVARAANIPVRFALLDRLDAEFNHTVMKHNPDAIDISTPYDKEHTFLPNDIHPNVKANQLFADRLIPVVSDLVAQTQKEGTP